MSLTHPVTVAIARFEDLVSAGLRALISEDPTLRIVAEGMEIDQLDTVIARERPQVAILNYGSLQAAADVRRLHTAHPDTHLLVLANRPTTAESSQMLALGATACMAKEIQGRDVLNAIHLASRGLHVLPRKASNGSPPVGAPTGPEALTDREADVFAHLQAGRSNAEIAMELSVSVETVRTHARNVFRKLGVRNRRELARN